MHKRALHQCQWLVTCLPSTDRPNEEIQNNMKATITSVCNTALCGPCSGGVPLLHKEMKNDSHLSCGFWHVCCRATTGQASKVIAWGLWVFEKGRSWGPCLSSSPSYTDLSQGCVFSPSSFPSCHRNMEAGMLCYYQTVNFVHSQKGMKSCKVCSLLSIKLHTTGSSIYEGRGGSDAD